METTIADSTTSSVHYYRNRLLSKKNGETTPEVVHQSAESEPCEDPETGALRAKAEDLEREFDEMDRAIPVEEFLRGAEADSRRMWDIVRQELPRVTDDLIQSYVAANRESMPLSLFSCGEISATVAKLSIEEHRTIFRCGWWPEFYSRYPHTSGVLHLSAPAFSTDGQLALVYIARKWGGLAGEGHIVLLKESDGDWLISGSIQLWLS